METEEKYKEVMRQKLAKNDQWLMTFNLFMENNFDDKEQTINMLQYIKRIRMRMKRMLQTTEICCCLVMNKTIRTIVYLLKIYSELIKEYKLFRITMKNSVQEMWKLMSN